MNVRISGAACQDLLDAFYFYEKREIGIGPYFLDSLFSDIDSLVIYAGIHPVFHAYYKMLSKRFPFAVYYKMENDEIEVFAVLDCRRNPAWIKCRLIRNVF